MRKGWKKGGKRNGKLRKELKGRWDWKKEIDQVTAFQGQGGLQKRRRQEEEKRSEKVNWDKLMMVDEGWWQKRIKQSVVRARANFSGTTQLG
jgi:hypothetical protein